MARVLVIGGGFAGLETAIFLGRKGVETTLVSDRDYVWIYPTSIWVPVGDDPARSRLSLPRLAKAHGFELIVDAVKGIDPAAQKIRLTDETVDYERLVIAVGAGKLAPRGIENTLSICGPPEQATLIRDRLLKLADGGAGRIAFGFGGNPKDKSAVRGGPLFEVMFNIDLWLRRRGLRDKFDLTFFAPMPVPGERMGERALAMMDRLLESKNIERRVGTAIVGFTENGIDFADQTRIDTDLTIFVPAGAGPPFVAEAGLPVNEAGFIRIDEQCRVEGHGNIWAVGDVAALAGPPFRAKQGHVAEVMARVAAGDIAESIRSNGTQRHGESYVPHVSILCLMDTGNGGAMIKRDTIRARVMALPIVGHWLKKGWGLYWRWSKLRLIPRLPGM